MRKTPGEAEVSAAVRDVKLLRTECFQLLFNSETVFASQITAKITLDILSLLRKFVKTCTKCFLLLNNWSRANVIFTFKKGKGNRFR